MLKAFRYIPIVIILFVVSFNACKNSDVTSPNNPFGTGNGKVSFYKTTNVPGGVSIVINGESKIDNGVWSSAPTCDTLIATNFILSAGSYTAVLTGQAVSCNKPFTITEGQCSLINYTSCTSPLPCLSDLDGIWTKIGDGSIPNSSGMRITVSGGIGTVTSIFTGNESFCVNDVKWKNFSNLTCLIDDLLPSTGCVVQNYSRGPVTVNAPNSISIAGQKYTK